MIIGGQAIADANLVAERISKEVERIARDPETSAPEPDVPGLPADAVARRATVSDYTRIRRIYCARWKNAPDTRPSVVFYTSEAYYPQGV